MNLSQQVEARVLRRAIWTALGKLSPVQRAAIVQHYYLEMNIREIASQTEAPQGTVQWRLHAARERLKTLLAYWVDQDSRNRGK